MSYCFALFILNGSFTKFTWNVANETFKSQMSKCFQHSDFIEEIETSLELSEVNVTIMKQGNPSIE